jgi:hypothetical protein
VPDHDADDARLIELAFPLEQASLRLESSVEAGSHG